MKTVKQVAETLGYNPMYVRKLARTGLLKASKNDYGFYVFEDIDVAAYSSKPAKTSKNVKSYVLQIPIEDMQEVEAFLQTLEINLEKRFVYDPVKSKIYRESKKEKKQ